MLRFRDPDSFVAGNLSACVPQWRSVLEKFPKKEEILSYITDGVNVFHFFTPFNGSFQGKKYCSNTPPFFPTRHPVDRSQISFPRPLRIESSTVPSTSWERPWHFKSIEDEGTFVKVSNVDGADVRYQTLKKGLLTENILEVKPFSSKGQNHHVVIFFKVPSAANGKANIKFDIEQLDFSKSHFSAELKPAAQASDLQQMELEKKWIDVYDQDLTNEQIRRLAAVHNMAKQSLATNWITRVHSCREWLYTMSKNDMEQDETPQSSSEWKKQCQKMYIVDADKDANTLKPTLQAALLRRRLSAV
ncbi:hypothetical protein QZH41_004593 [Actinostola sp. cb2023]|nr:hypothetical protein QZH41_004593 [Actinostola sp. cb2023]